MIFSRVSQMFERIAQEASRNVMTELLAELLSETSPQEAQQVSYLALGTLRAPYQPNQFNIAEKNMIKVLDQLFGKDMKAIVKKAGDVGKVVRYEPWPYEDKGLTVSEVYERLSTLQAITGTGSQEEKAVYLTELLKEVDALSASYIIKIILGTMRLGFSDMTLIDALSWMVTGDKSLKKKIEHAYNMCADIGRIAYILKKEGISAVEKMKPTLGIPIRPAAAERAENPQAIIDKIGPCVAQPKLDGFRLQIHIDKKAGKIWFFSRNLQDMSQMFPDLVEALQSVEVDSLIAEGEAIVYDEATQSFLPFQETVKRKRKHDIKEVAESLPLKLFLFDILYVNGESVMPKGHEERRDILLNYFDAGASEKINVIEERFCATTQELTDYFNVQITDGLEGLVTKRPDAIYQPGKRNFNWIKLKRHEGGHLADTIDAVILGYYAGRGKRATFGIGAFLVGVYNKEKDQFETIAKVGTGLTDEEWIELKKRSDTYKADEQPHNVICSQELRPDVWVDPVLVAVILADEITQSPMHTAARTPKSSGLALRFPRFMGYALDKTATQATSVDELKKLFAQQTRG